MNDWHPDKPRHNASNTMNVGVGAQTSNQPEAMVNIDYDSTEVKIESDLKEEPETTDDIFMVSISNQCRVPNVKLEPVDDSNSGIHNDGSFGSEDLSSAHVKSEPKAEKVRKANSKPKANRKTQSGGNGSSERKCSAKHSTKKNHGHRTLATELKSIDAKGRAKAVIIASHKKRSTAVQPNKQHKCSSCDYVTPLSANLKVHIRKHTGEKPFPCNICTKRFTRKHHLQTHLKSHTDGKYLFRCPVCLKRFTRNEEKSQHEATCVGRRFECHLCKRFSTPTKNNMVRHMRVHTGERPFRCDFCSKKFTLDANLNAHLKIHTNPRPVKFQCLVCARKFLQEVEKQQHELKCKNRRYECYICKIYTTSRKQLLLAHMHVHHTGVKPFECEQCQRCFYHKSHLNRHIQANHK